MTVSIEARRSAYPAAGLVPGGTVPIAAAARLPGGPAATGPGPAGLTPVRARAMAPGQPAEHRGQVMVLADGHLLRPHLLRPRCALTRWQGSSRRPSAGVM